MAGRVTHCLALLALSCSLVVAGCKDVEKEKALAEAKAAKTALAEVNIELEATQKERDILKADINDLSVKLGAATETAEQVKTLKDQVTQLTRDRDSALAKATEAQSTVEKLKTQLQEQTQKAAAIQEQNNRLQKLIDELKKIVRSVPAAAISGGGAPAPVPAAAAPGASDAGRPAPPTGAGPALAGKTIDVGNGVKLELVLIPAGSFDMGSPDSEKRRDSDEGPVHKVRIPKPFYIGKCEVTQEQYLAAMGSKPSKFSGQNLPVETVSWDEAAACCKKMGGRLPTEAEWEYACRAGSKTRFCYGDDLNDTQLGEYAWYSGNSGSTTHPVGRKKPNAFGLYDMHGNVYEWCSDWYASYANAQGTNPLGAPSGQSRVCRGGGWTVNAGFCRSANRHVFSPEFRSSGLGFRVVLDSN
jgi:formylglycine-generating enzyme required for sulfatase activity